jgi:hypothetical protein
MVLMKKLLVAVAAAASLAAFTLPAQAHGYVQTQGYGPQFQSGYVQVQHYGPPPPPRHEAMPGPRRGHQWVPGHWERRGPRHVWLNGYWVQQRPGYAYTQPAWRERDGRWDMDRGRWERRHDADGDGVPNRFDRRPNNPYRN